MEQSLDIGKYIDGVRRRLWLVALIFIPGALLATGIAYVLPPVYQSTARILVESPKIPQNLAQSTVEIPAIETIHDPGKPNVVFLRPKRFQVWFQCNAPVISP